MMVSCGVGLLENLESARGNVKHTPTQNYFNILTTDVIEIFLQDNLTQCCLNLVTTITNRIVPKLPPMHKRNTPSILSSELFRDTLLAR